MFPSFQELFNTFVAKFREQIPTIDPTVNGSWSSAFGRGNASSAYSIVISMIELQKQFNPLTATGTFLDLWASYDLITRLGASPSLGVIRVYGLDTTVVPALSVFAAQQNGLLYTNSVSGTIAPQDTDDPPVSLIDLSRSGTTVTAASSTPHGLAVGDWVQIDGADQSDYNILAQITTTSTLLEFTYEVTTTPATPATGAPFSATPYIVVDSVTIVSGVATFTTPYPNGLVDTQYIQLGNVTGLPSFDGIHQITVLTTTSFTVATGEGDQTLTSVTGSLLSVHANINVQSDDTGPNTVILPNALLDYQGIVAGIASPALTVEGLQGGVNEETDDQLRARLLLSRSAQEGIFTNTQIELAALLINGNTRIFIQNPDSDNLSDPDPVLPGQVRVYVLRDDDPLGPVPIGSILNLTKQSIINNGRLPAEMWQDDLEVLGPVLTDIDITLTNMLPNTATMRTAIKDQLNAYFTDDASFGEDLDDDVIRGQIILTQDLTTTSPEESFIKSFDLVVGIQSAITSVTDSGGSAQFNFGAGSTFSVGQSVAISGFITNQTYNGIYTIDSTDGSTFFVVTAIVYVSDETTGAVVAEDLTIEKNELPQLGVLTINGVEVS